MKTFARNVVHSSSGFGSKIRLVFFILTLVMFILAAGAPMAIGGIGG